MNEKLVSYNRKRHLLFGRGTLRKLALRELSLAAHPSNVDGGCSGGLQGRQQLVHQIHRRMSINRRHLQGHGHHITEIREIMVVIYMYMALFWYASVKGGKVYFEPLFWSCFTRWNTRKRTDDLPVNKYSSETTRKIV